MDIETNRKQNRRLTVFACLLSFVSIGLLVFGFFLVSSDKVVLLQSISNLSSKINKVLDNNSVIIDKLATSKDIGIRSNIVIDSEEDLNIKFDYLENNGSDKSKLDLDMTLNNTDTFNADLLLSDSKINFFIDDVTPSYYYTDLEYFSIFFDLGSDDYDRIISFFKESITDYIDNDDIKKQKVEINYNGKDKKVNKLTYEITNKTVKDIMSDFINSLKNDKVLINQLADFLNTDVSDLGKKLDEVLTNFDYKENKHLYNYIVYYYGFNKIVGYELELVQEKVVFEYKVQEKQSISLYENDLELLKIEVSNNKKQTNISGFIVRNNNKINFTGNLSNNNLILYFGMLDSSKVRVDIKYNNQESEKLYTYKSDILVSSIMNDKETELYKINISLEYYFDEIINTRLDNSVNIKDIKEEDIVTIYNNLLDNAIYKSIFSLLNNVLKENI